MRILYHHRTMGRGAEGVHINSIVKAFEKLGHHVTVISPPGVDPLDTVGQCPLDKTKEETKGINSLWKYVSKKTPQIVFEFLEIGYNLLSVLKIRNEIKNNHFHFIYERNAYFLFAGALISKFYGIPLVVEANEVVGIKRARPLIMKALAHLMEKATFHTAASIFTVSSYLKTRILEVNDSYNKVYITPNAIDPEEYIQKTRRNEIRQKYGIDNNIVIGFAGWFDWWDRLDLLIDVQKEIVDKGYDNVSALIIGDGPMTSDLKDQVKRLGLGEKIIFTGAVVRQDVIHYIDAMDIGVFSHSNQFGSPVVLFEMMGLGKTIVAPKLKPITDVIEHDKTGIIFSPLDKTSLIESILSLVDNPEKIYLIGNSARKMVLKYHSWEGNAIKIIDSLKDKF
ncbi:MAG: glycosyltransferase family 4 protein [Bacteroidales bacterium]|nr:glycosyltransferase family 4 protein [Bacteroidales bacterium]